MNTLRMIGNELRAISYRVFRRPAPIDDAKALADFIDQHAAFVIQKGIYEYSRARAGHYAKVLFKEPPFVRAVDRSRWLAYPIGLAMVGELAEGVLRPFAGDDRSQQLASLRALVLSVFDRYPVPAELGASAWSDARTELSRRMQLIGLHAPKRAFEIADPFVKAYFDMMPINEKLRRSEFPTIHGYLKVTLCNVHDELSKRLDAPAVVRSLGAQQSSAADLRWRDMAVVDNTATPLIALDAKVIDKETTALDARKAQIVEIAALWLGNEGRSPVRVMKEIRSMLSYSVQQLRDIALKKQ